jgi:hypothetical protein
VRDIGERFNLLQPQNPLVLPSVLWRNLAVGLHPEKGHEDPIYTYTQGEQERLLDVAESNRARISSLPSFSQPLWITSGGPPGSGKSTELLRFIAKQFGIPDYLFLPSDWMQSNLITVIETIFSHIPAAWISPDRGSLLDLTTAAGHLGFSDFSFYEKWRQGSIFASNSGLNWGHAGRHNIGHDTTLAGYLNLPRAQQDGFYTVADITAAPFDVRKMAVTNRNQTYFQTYPSNLTEQDLGFNKNLPKIIASSNEMFIRWRDVANEFAHRIAFIREDQIAIYDKARFANFCALYPKMHDEILPNLNQNKTIKRKIPTILQKQRAELGRRLII